MIRNTFSVLDGVGEKTEKRLWRRGIVTWDDFLGTETIPFISRQKKLRADERIRKLDSVLNNPSLFARHVDRKEHWRAFEIFRDDAVGLDIETNGRPYDNGGYVTVVGLYDGRNYKCLIRGRDLTQENLMESLSPYKYLITFFGAVFDIPFLRRCYQYLRIDMPHYDICLESKRLGLKGGFKYFEKCFGINRDDDIAAMDGYDAVKLWQMYKRGDRASLDTLIKYNREDTVNLMPIGEEIYNQLKKSTGIEEYINGQ
ncbi:ribonuclease H-like domain-containing protein [Candidatus Magnetominusculus dajiuhuensis]|uniref:ribonuclease H-like domain-containing protein n=1 Tax=Candidatus Magnetominusculus dajiuhuensis TaxID=3137712 RepID=UPI003B42BA95